VQVDIDWEDNMKSHFFQTRGVAITILILLSTASIITSSQSVHAQKSGTLVVAAVQSQVRQSPSPDAAVVVVADRNTEFKITGSNEGWIKVMTKSGEGWLLRSEVGLKVRGCVEMGLRGALLTGAIAGGFFGRGSSTGDSIVLGGQSALKLAVCPKLQPNTVLINNNPGAQNMVIRRLRGTESENYLRPAAALRFTPAVAIEYVFEAYCINFTRANPSQSDKLVPAETAPDALQKILKVRSSNIVAMQLAIWAVTDNPSAADACSHFSASDADIVAAK
jgi:hypothetical protein